MVSQHSDESFGMLCGSNDEPVLNLFPHGAFAESARPMIRFVNRSGQNIPTVAIDSIIPTRTIMQISHSLLDSCMTGCNIQIALKLMRRLRKIAKL